MELQLGSGRVDFLVKAHSMHNVKWVLTATGYTHFQEEFTWSGWIVSSSVLQPFFLRRTETFKTGNKKAKNEDNAQWK